MRLRQIIKENTDQEDDFYEYFEVEGLVEFTPKGVNVHGLATLRREKVVSELPIKFNKIDDGGIETNSHLLKNLNNFPNSTESIALYNASNLTSTSSVNGDINCDEIFIASAHKIQNFENTSLRGVTSVKLYKCENFESLKGLELDKIEYVQITDCPKFQDDLAKLPNLKMVVLSGNVSDNFPILKLIMTERLKFSKGYSTNLTGVAAILAKYQDKELFDKNYTMHVMRDLKANGLFNAARL